VEETCEPGTDTVCPNRFDAPGVYPQSEIPLGSLDGRERSNVFTGTMKSRWIETGSAPDSLACPRYSDGRSAALLPAAPRSLRFGVLTRSTSVDRASLNLSAASTERFRPLLVYLTTLEFDHDPVLLPGGFP